MNRSTWRKIWGDLWTRKGRTLLVSISIFIGVVGVVTLITAGDLLVKQLQEDVKADNLPMLQIYMMIPPDKGDVELDNQAYLDDLQAAFPSITEIEGEANNPFYWKFQDENRFHEARLFSYTTPLTDKTLEPMRLVEGDYPQPGHNQIAVEQRMAEDFELEVGDQIDLRMLGLDEFPTQTWTVSAIVFHAYNDASKQAMYVPFEETTAISGIPGLNILNLRFTDYPTAQASQQAVQAHITQSTPYAAVFVMSEDPAKNQSIESTEDFRTILSVLAIVAMLVCGFLVLNVISNLVSEQRRQIGVMKSLGTTRVETFLIYGGIAASYGIIGMIPGVLVGIPLGYAMATIVGDFANTLIDSFAVSPIAIILGASLGLAVPIISAFVPVYFGTRVSILEAMTDLGIGGSYRIGFLSRVVKSLPVPLNIKQSLNNLLQKKARLALTVITLTLALTAFMGVSAVFVRINEVLQDILDQFEFQAVFQTTQSQPLETIEPLIMNNVDGVKEVYPGSASIVQLEGYVSAQNESNQVIVDGVVTDRGFEEGDFTKGRGWLDDPERDGVVLTNDITNQIHKTVGDTVTLTANGEDRDFEIIGIMNYPFPIAFMRWQDLAEFTGFTLDGQPVPNAFYVLAEQSDPTARDMDKLIERINDKLVENGITASFTNMIEISDMASNAILSIGIVLNVASGIMAAVGAIGLITTLSIAVFERQKEIGVMRSVGAKSPTIIMQFLVEGILVGVLAWLLAAPLSVLLAWFLTEILPFGDFIEF
ncbi:MAG TPA: FtsX-like permease family protein, partial [Aggregatilineaceae bacterium]|nr:FtsX-like permease family protein [Aggregatilineaceae bacterium]